MTTSPNPTGPLLWRRCLHSRRRRKVRGRQRRSGEIGGWLGRGLKGSMRGRLSYEGCKGRHEPKGIPYPPLALRRQEWKATSSTWTGKWGKGIAQTRPRGRRSSERAFAAVPYVLNIADVSLAGSSSRRSAPSSTRAHRFES